MTPTSPRLLFSTAPFFLRPVEEAFAAASDAGFARVEVMVTRDPASQRSEDLTALAYRYDLSIEAIHAPFLALTRSVFGSDPIGKVRRTVALAQDLSVPTVIAHPPYRWQGGYARWLSAELESAQQRSGVTIAIENMCPLGPIPLHEHTTLERMDAYPDLTLDTSHAGVVGMDLSTVARQHADRLRHVHLSDNRGSGWDSHALVGEGVLPLAEFMDTLQDTDFSGSVSLELNLRRWLGERDALRRILTNQRRSCEALLPSFASA